MSKVIRWHCVGVTPHAANGNFVALEDYESLQAALREALANWQELINQAKIPAHFGEPLAKPIPFQHDIRIAQLRKKFLDDK